MSFRPIFAPNVLLKWKRLDFELQELALDILEEAVDSPPDPVRDGNESTFIIRREVKPGRVQELTLYVGWLNARQTAVIVGLDYRVLT